MLFAAVYYFCSLPGEFLRALSVMIMMAIVGVTVGAAISTVAKSEELATALVPMALIPQIILSSGLKPLHGLGNGIAQSLIGTYWGLGMLRSTLPASLQTFLLSPSTDFSVSIGMLAFQSVFLVSLSLWAIKYSMLGLPSNWGRLLSRIGLITQSSK